MARLLVLLVIVALVAFIVLKLVKGASASGAAPRRQRDAEPDDAKLVRCGSCGAFVPRTDALPSPDGSFRCSDPKCRAA